MPQLNKKRSRVLIVDDHPAVREALALRISRQPDLEVCGEASDMPEAIHQFSNSHPDVVVTDISLKTGNGLELIKRLRDRDARTRILVWSMHSESLYARRALQAGALGYVNKDQATEKIVEAIREVLAGKIWLSDAVTAELLRQVVEGKSNSANLSPVDDLSDRELEVFRLIGEGVKTADIAQRLHLSIKTIETYRDRIRTKLNLSSGAELARAAAQWVLENQ